MSLQGHLARARVLVCVGSGGVGKTSVSAALGLAAARAGRRVLVMTVDPARRLAQAMGLESLSLEARRIDLGPARGELWAMMVDTKSTWDKLISRHAPNPETRERIFANRFYQHLSTALAGSQELAAMEQLHHLEREGGYDLLILDTPPTANALDFLNAPERVLGVLDRQATGWLVRPYLAAGRLGFKAMGVGSGFLIRMLSRFTGAETLQDLAEFLSSFEGMYGGFSERARQVHSLLRAPDTVFYLVTAPGRHPLDEALYFYRRLQEVDIPVAGFIVNRVHPDFRRPQGGPVLAPEVLARRLHRDHPGHFPQGASLQELLTGLWQVWLETRARAEADRRALAALERVHQEGEEVYTIPMMPHDLHDLEGLDLLAEALFSPA